MVRICVDEGYCSDKLLPSLLGIIAVFCQVIPHVFDAFVVRPLDGEEVGPRLSFTVFSGFVWSIVYCHVTHDEVLGVTK